MRRGCGGCGGCEEGVRGGWVRRCVKLSHCEAQHWCCCLLPLSLNHSFQRRTAEEEEVARAFGGAAVGGECCTSGSVHSGR